MKRRHIEHVNPRRMVAQLKRRGQTRHRQVVSAKSSAENIGMTLVDQQALDELQEFRDKYSSQEKVDRLLQMFESASMQNPQMIKTSHVGTTKGIVDAAMQVQPSNRDEVQELVDGIVDVSVGDLPDQMFGYGSSTMDAAKALATAQNSDWITSGIQGATSRATSGSSISITASMGGKTVSLKVSVPQICSASTTQANGTLEMVNTAMKKGMSCIKSLTSKVGPGNGARDMLTATLDSSKKMAIAYLMTKVMGVVNTVHPYSHPLFVAILQMAWSENQQWVPDFLANNIKREFGVSDLSNLPNWNECKKEISEFFDFVQDIFGGAIDAVWDGSKEMFEQVAKCCGGYDEESIKKAVKEGKCEDFPKPPLNVPNMSIGKQVEDSQSKLSVIKEMIRQKAKMVLYKLRSLEGPDMSKVPPRQMKLLMEVLIEVEVIYQNLHMVIDKIVEVILNMFVQQFAKVASQILDQVFEIWKDVKEAVPPLEDLLDMCFGVPKQADSNVNMAMNIALPQAYGIVQPFMQMPFNAVDTIAKACDAATKEAYDTPTPK